MNTAVSHPQTPEERKLQETLDRVARGIHDPEEGRKAMERLDNVRAEMERRFGVQELAVDLIREVRDR